MQGDLDNHLMWLAWHGGGEVTYGGIEWLSHVERA